MDGSSHCRMAGSRERELGIEHPNPQGTRVGDWKVKTYHTNGVLVADDNSHSSSVGKRGI